MDNILKLINKDNKIILWYIDIIDDYGVDDDGAVYINDLFLDIIVHPNGSIKIVDKDELDLALEQSIITGEQYDKALNTCNKLLNSNLKNKLSCSSFSILM